MNLLEKVVTENLKVYEDEKVKLTTFKEVFDFRKDEVLIGNVVNVGVPKIVKKVWKDVLSMFCMADVPYNKQMSEMSILRRKKFVSSQTNL